MSHQGARMGRQGAGRAAMARPGPCDGRRGRAPMRSAGDRGSGTVWTVALIGCVWAVATMAMAVGGARAARHRAYAAADLAALAAAAHIADGTGDACRLATRIARESGGRLRGCRFHHRIVDVEVTSEARPWPGFGVLTATVRARAGPVDEAPAFRVTSEPGSAGVVTPVVRRQVREPGLPGVPSRRRLRRRPPAGGA